MFLNPLYVIQDLSKSDPGEALAAYVFSYVGQTALMVIWLCLADSMSYNESNFMSAALFYVPKIVFGIIVFTPACIVVAYQFPSFTVSVDRSPVEAIQMWPKESKEVFCYFSLAFLVLYWCWALAWFLSLYLNYRRLAKMPYMSTRYRQLLFRFYLLQASLVTTYYVLQYALGAHYIAQDNFGEQDLTELTDEVNTLFKQQTEQFGKGLFLAILAVLLAFVTLPSAFLLESDTLSAYTAAFAITEAEKEEMTQQRIEALGRRDLRSGETIFCVDLALAMLKLSLEAYNETIGDIHQVRESMNENLRDSGYTVVEIISRAEENLLGILCKHKETNELVVAFRGSVSRQNMRMNFDHDLVALDLSAMNMPSLDAQDGLNESEAGEPERVRKDVSASGNLMEALRKLRRASGGALRGLSEGMHGSDSNTGIEEEIARRGSQIETEVKLHVNHQEVSLDGPVPSPLASYATDAATAASAATVPEIPQQSQRTSTGILRKGNTCKTPQNEHPQCTEGDTINLNTSVVSATLDNMTGVVVDGVDKVSEILSTGVDKGSEILLLAIHNTIGLSSLTPPRVHSGFFGSYRARYSSSTMIWLQEFYGTQLRWGTRHSLCLGKCASPRVGVKSTKIKPHLWSTSCWRPCLSLNI